MEPARLPTRVLTGTARLDVAAAEIAILGYRLIQRYDQWVSTLSALVFLFLTVRLFQTEDVVAAAADSGPAPAGRYGRYNVRALTAYVVGIVLQLAFMNTTFYVGPLVDDLAGADIA